VQFRIGYHHTRDDAVSSSWWSSTDWLTHKFIAELMQDDEVDEVWVRHEDKVIVLKGG
jgi:hypothetical protein